MDFNTKELFTRVCASIIRSNFLMPIVSNICFPNLKYVQIHYQNLLGRFQNIFEFHFEYNKFLKAGNSFLTIELTVSLAKSLLIHRPNYIAERFLYF